MKQIPVLQQFAWQPKVINFLGAPPGSPTKGDAYIIESGTGDWSGKDDQIARYTTEWEYTLPFDGMFVWVSEEENLYEYNDGWTSWDKNAWDSKLSYESGHNEGLLEDPTITWDEDIMDNGTKIGTKIDVPSVDVYIRNDDEWGANQILYRKTVPAKNLSLQPLGIWYIYVGWNEGDPEYFATQNRGLINNSDVIPVARICSCPEQAELEYVAYYGSIGRSASIRNFDRIMRIRGYGGFEKESGLTITEEATRVIRIDDGIAWFGLKRASLDDITQDASNTYLYYKSAGAWTRELVDQYNNWEYNDGTNKVELSPNRFAVNWVYRNFVGDEIAIVLGEGNYRLSDAESSYIPAVPPRIPNFHTLLGRIIVRKGEDTATAIENIVTTVFESAVTNEHNDLAEIQGGTTEERYHLTENEHTISTQEATDSVDGYLSSTDWTTFNNKLDTVAHTDLTDTPGDYDDAAGHLLAVTSGQDGIEFIDVIDGGSA